MTTNEEALALWLIHRQLRWDVRSALSVLKTGQVSRAALMLDDAVLRAEIDLPAAELGQMTGGAHDMHPLLPDHD